MLSKTKISLPNALGFEMKLESYVFQRVSKDNGFCDDRKKGNGLVLFSGVGYAVHKIQLNRPNGDLTKKKNEVYSYKFN